MSLPRYERYKDSGVPYLGEVPHHWAVKRLKNNLQLLTEKTERRENPVALENIEGWSGRFIPTETEFEGESVAFEAGDILFGKLRPYLAKAYLAQMRGEAVGDFHVLRPALGVEARFAQYQLLNRDFIALVDGSTYGSKMPRASWEFVASMVLTTPPRPEQEAIATFLDRETAKIDGLIEEQKRLTELLKEKRQAVISRAVTKGLNPSAPMEHSGVPWLGELPTHWDVTRLGNIFTNTDIRGDNTLPVLSVSIHDGVSDSELDDAESDRKVTRSDDRTKYERVAPGDLVYNMMQAWQGGFGTVAVEGMVSPAYVVARPILDVPTQFIELLLRTPNAVEEMRRHSRGVTDFRLRLYWDEFKTISIAMPPIGEVVEILKNVQLLSHQFDRVVGACEECISALRERRSALISAAVTGKIDVRSIAEQRQAEVACASIPKTDSRPKSASGSKRTAGCTSPVRRQATTVHWRWSPQTWRRG